MAGICGSSPSELTLVGGPKFLRFNVSYLFFNEEESAATGEPDEREELRGGATVLLTDEWSVFGSFVYDLAPGGGLLSWGFGARFQNECCRLIATFTRSEFRDRDIEPSNRFLLQVTLKHLGEIRSGQ